MWRLGVLAAPLGDAFRGYELFEHQLEAIQLGAAGNDFVVTSGTGSGKSLTYIAAIFDHLFKSGNPMPNGVTAVIVYPLNALVNSQEEELRRYADNYSKSRHGEKNFLDPALRNSRRRKTIPGVKNWRLIPPTFSSQIT